MNTFPEAGRAFEASQHRLLDWFLGSALPFFSTRGTDHARGGCFERFDDDGVPLEEAKRTRVTARQLYVFSVAHELGHPQGMALMAHALRFLTERQLGPDGLFTSSVAPDGSPGPSHFDLYEQAFGLFALARAHRTAPDAATRSQCEQLARQTLAVLEAHFRHPSVGFEESAPPRPPLRSNPHMHLLEAAMAWADTAQAPGPWQALCQGLMRLCLTHFIDPTTGALRELFNRQWQALPAEAGQVIEPGHQFEWAWLLLRAGPWWAAAPPGSPSPTHASHAAHRLVALAEQHGVCRRRGVAFNTLTTDLHPLDTAAKLWPQTERIKAWCAVAGQAHDGVQRDHALAQASLAMDALMPYLRHPTPGLWREVMLDDGTFQQAPCRTSSLYHIVCAIETTRAVTVPGAVNPP